MRMPEHEAAGFEVLDAPRRLGSLSPDSDHGRFEAPSLARAKGRAMMDDDGAIALFLESYGHSSPHTRRAYRKEVERFLLWLRHNHPGEPRLLPQVTAATISEYIAFMDRPTPFPADFLIRHGRQIEPHRAPKGVASPVAQPFSGPLSIRSKAHSVTVLRMFFDAITNVDGGDGRPYCQFNPLRTMRGFSAKAIRSGDSPRDRGFSFQEWSYVQSVIANPIDATAIRQRWIVMMLYLTFVRREEAVRLTTRDLTPSRNGAWSLRVFGKGGATRTIVASAAFMEEFSAYMRSLRKPSLPVPGLVEPLVQNTWGSGPVGPQVIYSECRHVFARAAVVAEAAGDTRAAQRLRQASPHWLRHTGISHALELGIEARYVQAQAGHESLSTTGIYDHKERDAWERSFERMGSAVEANRR